MATDDFADWLTVALKEKGIKPAELARKAGIDKSIISRILKRERKPEPETLQAIARGFKLPYVLVYRAAGMFAIDPEADALTEEGHYILQQLEGEDKEDAVRLLRLRLQVVEERGKYSVRSKKRPATSA